MLDIPRAASRNVLVADDRGVLLDAELLCKEAAVISGADDLLVHANHLEAPQFKGYEKPTENSLTRRRRLQELIESAKAPLTIEDIRGFYRDHAGAPHTLCAHPFPGRNVQTVVSVIGNLTARTLDVARGTPCRNPYATYTIATCRQGAQSVTVEEFAGA
jgi:isopenicillin-N N-acyltransferase-like protein